MRGDTHGLIRVMILYRLFILPVLALLFLKNLKKMWQRGGYWQDIGHRFGFLPCVIKKKPRLWIQAVSVGEVNAIKPLVEQLHHDFEIVLTTTTTTARKIIREQLEPYLLWHGYFPWDFWLFSVQAWRRVQPDAIILVESELWPEHLYQARQHKVPAILVNARLSDRSFQRYQKVPWIAKKLFRQVFSIVASSEEGRQRIAMFFEKNIAMFGNLKFDRAVSPMEPAEKEALKQELGFPRNTRILLGCSTWPGEESMLLEVFQQLKDQNYRLLLVPRHAERREDVLREIIQANCSYHQRSFGVFKGDTQGIDVCLADTTGELTRLTQIADLAFVGKSLEPNAGGQSPLDAAHAGVALVYGNHMENFRELCRQIEAAHGAIRVSSHAEAIRVLVELAQDDEARKSLANNLKIWANQNRGASEKTAQYIINLIKTHK